MPIGLALIVLANLLSMPFGCARLEPPMIDHSLVRSYAPGGLYGGHWGVDYGAVPGTIVTFAAAGTVTFAGSVAGRLSVTVAHGGDLRTSYSYLQGIRVRVGRVVLQGTPLGLSGIAHGVPALHFSVRVGSEYRDPALWLICVPAPAPGLRLLPVFGRSVYPRKRATRHPRRNLRSPSHRAPLRRRGGLPRSQSRHRHVRSRGGAVAKGRSLRLRLRK